MKILKICSKLLIIVLIIGVLVGLTNTNEKKKVQFISDGTTYSVCRVVKGKNITLPEDPTKEGYTFKGWSLSDGGEVIDLSTKKITKNTTYYAIFEKITEEPSEPEVVNKITITYRGTSYEINEGTLACDFLTSIGDDVSNYYPNTDTFNAFYDSSANQTPLNINTYVLIDGHSYTRAPKI